MLQCARKVRFYKPCTLAASESEFDYANRILRLKSYESYVQEIGRAGRDGLPAECHVFLEAENTDLNELEKHTYSHAVDASSIRQLLSMIYEPCKCRRLAEATGSTTENSCPGHERAIMVDTAVQRLNIPEEGIATLLYYLELHNSSWLENLSPVYSTCTVKSYSGAAALHQAASKCIPLGCAMALAKKKGKKVDLSLTFSIMDVAEILNKPSGFLKRELKQLQWIQTPEGKYKRSSLVVEFSNLSMRVSVPGNLGDDELDEILNFLKRRVEHQQTKELAQLHVFYDTLQRLAYKDYFMVSEKADSSRSQALKTAVTEYFSAEQTNDVENQPHKELTPEEEGNVRSIVNSFLAIHSHEHDFTGLAVAKILYGIASPNYPANVWGRVRRFWRSLLGFNFNSIVKIATEQLIDRS